MKIIQQGLFFLIDPEEVAVLLVLVVHSTDHKLSILAQRLHGIHNSLINNYIS
jgi:hypothetical protein